MLAPILTEGSLKNQYSFISGSEVVVGAAIDELPSPAVGFSSAQRRLDGLGAVGSVVGVTTIAVNCFN